MESERERDREREEEEERRREGEETGHDKIKEKEADKPSLSYYRNPRANSNLISKTNPNATSNHTQSESNSTARTERGTIKEIKPVE